MSHVVIIVGSGAAGLTAALALGMQEETAQADKTQSMGNGS